MRKIFILSMVLSSLTHFTIYGKIADCEIVKYTSRFKVSAKKLVQTDTVIYQVNNRNGENFTNISIPYSKIEKISDVSVWLEESNGSLIRTLKKDEITDKNRYSENTLYSDYYVKKFYPKHNTYPYRICYTFTRTSSEYFVIADWNPFIKLKFPVYNAKLYCEVPVNFPIHISKSGIETEGIDTINGMVRYNWSASYNTILKDEEWTPPLLSFLPYVLITPDKFTFGTNGCSASWVSFGKWLSDLNTGLDDLPEPEKAKAMSIVKDAKDNREKVKLLYGYLQQNTRYINVSLNIGGIKPYPAEYVCINKYGDCKALTIYMKALLKAVGINSYYTLIQADITPVKINSNFPYPAFNHAILTVPIGKDTLWLDNTDNINPFGYVNMFIQNRTALLVDNNQSKLIEIPVKHVFETMNVKRLDFYIDDSNEKTILKTNYGYKGENYEFLHSIKTLYNDYEQDQYIHERFSTFNFDSLSWDLKGLHSDSSEIHLFANLVLSNYFKHLDNGILLPVLQIALPKFELPVKRTLPVQLPYPVCGRDTIVYHFTPVHRTSGISEVKTISSSFGTYACEVKISSSAITICKEYILNDGYIPLHQYKDFYQFLTAIHEFETKLLLLN